MIESFILYLLLFIIIILQIVIVLLLSSKLKSIVDLLNTLTIEMKALKYISTIPEPKVEIKTHAVKTEKSTTDEKIPSSFNSSIPIQDNEEVLFIKEIKLNKSSNVIDMDVQVNSRSK